MMIKNKTRKTHKNKTTKNNKPPQRRAQTKKMSTTTKKPRALFLSFKGQVPQITPRTYVAPSATIIGNVKIGPESVVLSTCTLRGDNDLISIGHHSNIQEASVLHTDPGLQLIIGNNVSVGHRAMIHGCTIGDNTIIGMGATVMNRAKVGANCIVGANTLITEGKEFPDNSVIVGSPGKVVRECTEKDIAMIARTALAYSSKVDSFMEMEEVLPILTELNDVQASI